MGVGELRDAFNAVSQPAFTCTLALLDYVRAHDTESQVLLFRGSGADGAPFEIRSDPLRASYDLNVAAKEVAQRLLDQVPAPQPAPPEPAPAPVEAAPEPSLAELADKAAALEDRLAGMDEKDLVQLQQKVDSEMQSRADAAAAIDAAPVDAVAEPAAVDTGKTEP